MQLHATATAPHRMPLLESDPWCSAQLPGTGGGRAGSSQDREWFQVHLVPKHWEAPLSVSPSPTLPPLTLLVPGDAFVPNPKKIDEYTSGWQQLGAGFRLEQGALGYLWQQEVSVSSKSITMCSSNIPWPPGKEGHWSLGLPCRSSLLLLHLSQKEEWEGRRVELGTNTSSS